MKRSSVLSGLTVLGALGVFGILMAGVPEGKAVITIDQLKGKKGAVTFQHAKHVDSYKKADGSAIECKDCHHTLKDASEASKAQACSACHVEDGTALKEVDGKKAPILGKKTEDGGFETKSVILHGKCLECHKAVKEKDPSKTISGCSTCHPKK